MEWDELGRCFIIIILSRVRATFRLQRDEASTGSHKSLSWKIVDYIFVSWSKTEALASGEAESNQLVEWWPLQLVSVELGLQLER